MSREFPAKQPSLTGNERVDSAAGYLALLGRETCLPHKKASSYIISLILLVVECRNRHLQFPALCSDGVVPSVFFPLRLYSSYYQHARTGKSHFKVRINLAQHCVQDTDIKLCRCVTDKAAERQSVLSGK